MATKAGGGDEGCPSTQQKQVFDLSTALLLSQGFSMGWPAPCPRPAPSPQGEKP
jgi:hypothetical protein